MIPEIDAAGRVFAACLQVLRRPSPYQLSGNRVAQHRRRDTILPVATRPMRMAFCTVSAGRFSPLALQLHFLEVSESMGNHDSKIVDTGSID
jgi:hypothetical protein